MSLALMRAAAAAIGWRCAALVEATHNAPSRRPHRVQEAADLVAEAAALAGQ